MDNAYMDYKQLLFFKKTAELQHMTRAAEELNVSQSFLSSTISGLEASLGVKLFSHVGRGIVLNEYGKAFYQHVVKIFNESEDAYRELQDMAGKNSMTLRIGTNCGLYMPGLLKFIRGQVPDLRVQMISIRQFKMEKLLEEGRIDFAVSPAITDREDFESTLLIEEEGVIVYAQDHWLNGRDQINLRDVEQESFIESPDGYGTTDIVKNCLADYAFHPTVSIVSTDTTSAFSFVRESLGIAFAPKTIAMEDPFFRTHYIAPSDISLRGSIALSWRRGQYITDVGRKFIDLAGQYFTARSEKYLSAN